MRLPLTFFTLPYTVLALRRSRIPHGVSVVLSLCYLHCWLMLYCCPVALGRRFRSIYMPNICSANRHRSRCALGKLVTGRALDRCPGKGAGPVVRSGYLTSASASAERGEESGIEGAGNAVQRPPPPSPTSSPLQVPVDVLLTLSSRAYSSQNPIEVATKSWPPYARQSHAHEPSAFIQPRADHKLPHLHSCRACIRNQLCKSYSTS